MESTFVSFSEHFLSDLPVQFSEPLLEMQFDCPIISESMRPFPIEFEQKLSEPELGSPCQPDMEVFSQDGPEFSGFYSGEDHEVFSNQNDAPSEEHSVEKVAPNGADQGWYFSIQDLISRMFHGIRNTQSGSAVTS